MTRDESKYHKPHRFNLDRFFTLDGQLNDDNTIFLEDGESAGQLFSSYKIYNPCSVCVGRHAADATVWATIVSVLSVFDFDFAEDASGNVIPIEGKCTDVLIR